ncbi:MAG: SRPBCC family protein [Candidatus Dormibacteria bacterium]
MKIEGTIEVAASPAEAYTKLSDTRLLATVFAGIMDWYPTDAPNRFRTVVRAGPAPLGGEIELEFWPEAGTVTWHSTRGVHQMGRFLVKKQAVGSLVTLRIFYHLDGGMASRLAEWIVAVRVQRDLRETLRRLARSIEAQPPRPHRGPRAAAGV